MGSVAVFLVGLWLAVLSLIVVLLIRQLGLMAVRLNEGSFNLSNDGPAVGSKIPGNVVEAIPSLAMGRHHLLLISSHCLPCRELVAGLDGVPVHGLTALVAGREDEAQGLVDLMPQEINNVLDPQASEIAGSLHIQSTPFAVKIEDGLVAGKRYITGAQDLSTFVADNELPILSSGNGTGVGR